MLAWRTASIVIYSELRDNFYEIIQKVSSSSPRLPEPMLSILYKIYKRHNAESPEGTSLEGSNTFDNLQGPLHVAASQ